MNDAMDDFSEDEVAIVVQCLDEITPLEKFTLDKINPLLFQWELGGLTDPIGQLFAWLWEQVKGAFDTLTLWFDGALRTAKDAIMGAIAYSIEELSKALSSLLGNIWGVVNLIPGIFDTISHAIANGFNFINSVLSTIGTYFTGITAALYDLGKKVAGFITSLPALVAASFSALQTWLSQLWGTISGSLSNILSALGSGIAAIGTLIGNIASSIGALATQLWNSLSSFADTIVKGISGFITSVWDKISGAFQVVGSALAGVTQGITSFFKSIWDLVGSLGTGILSAFTGFAGQVQGFLADTQTFFSGVLDTIKGKINDVGTVLQGFINPLTQIYSFFATTFTNFIDSFTTFFKDPRVGDVLDKQLTFTQQYIPLVRHHSLPLPYLETGPMFAQQYPRSSTEVLAIDPGIVGDIFKWISDAFSAAIEGITSAIVGIGGVVAGLATGLVDTVKGIGTGIGASLLTLVTSLTRGNRDTIEKALTAELEGQVKPAIMKGTVGQASLFDMTLQLFLLPFFASAGVSASLYGIGDLLNDIEIDIDLTPFGIGFSGKKKFNLGWYLKGIAKHVWKFPEMVINAVSYGFGAFAFRPLGRMYAATMRNELPVELPDLPTMVEATRRMMPTPLLEDHTKFVTQQLRYYGYNDTVIDWYTKKDTELNVTVTDRFGQPRKFPVGLQYDLPSPTDVARMMIHDQFASLEDFQKVIGMRGMNKDTAYMYYLLHYRYPPPELLWTFVSRARAGMLWYKKANAVIPEVSAGLGFAPLSPADLNEKMDVVLGGFETYLKWHDYAPFSWIPGFTSDRWMMLDVMADLPARMDARLLYKWKIIDDTSLRKIVMASGMHPSWVDPIAVTEAMNAITEERSYARGGVLTLYAGGWMNGTNLASKLNILTTVKILDKDYPVGFLESESKLVMIRASYDRIGKLSQGTLDVMEYGIERSYVDPGAALKTISGFFAKLSTGFEMDSSYVMDFLQLASIRGQFETLNRIRYLTRTVLYRVSQLADMGEDPKPYIDAFIKKAMLTEAERDVLYEFLDVVSSRFEKRDKLRVAQEIIAGRLKRGEITTAEGITLLVQAGMTQGQAEAYMETHAKFRTVSTDKLISMMEYIPIDLNVLKRKMDAEGVPLDEQIMYVSYALGHEIKTELDKYVTAIAAAYVKGDVTEADFIEELDNTATLWGDVQKYAGVPWIIYSPNERAILLKVYQVRRAMKLVA
jgi:hypothetical protein